MKVKNLTDKSQTLWIRDLLLGGSIPVEVLPNEPREIAKNYMPDESRTPNFHELFEVVINYHREEVSTKEVDETEEVSETEAEDDVDKSTAEPETITDKFICDICGAEFGSAQGLKMHMTRSHSSDS